VPEPATVRMGQSDLAEACVSGEGGRAYCGRGLGVDFYFMLMSHNIQNQRALLKNVRTWLKTRRHNE